VLVLVLVLVLVRHSGWEQNCRRLPSPFVASSNPTENEDENENPGRERGIAKVRKYILKTDILMDTMVYMINMEDHKTMIRRGSQVLAALASGMANGRRTKAQTDHHPLQ
jgi:hypothetical protein